MTFSADSKFVARVVPSPNIGPRTLPIDMIVLHYTEQTGPDALERLCDPVYKVSSHYLVYVDGRIDQLVAEADRGQHAGVSMWEGITDNNSRSIGIEIVNAGHSGGLPDFPDVQIDAVIALCRDIIARHHVRADRVVAHSDVAPARKIDPGEKFPWGRLAAAGVGLWVEPVPFVEGPSLSEGAQGPEVMQLQAQLARYGYGIEATGRYDDATKIVVSAFQRHFRPARVDGVADVSTVATLRRLLNTRDLTRMTSRLACPVCGFAELAGPPYDEHGVASFEICPCCGVEFGYEDFNRTFAELRAAWIKGGKRWTFKTPPAGWDADAQLRKARFEATAC